MKVNKRIISSIIGISLIGGTIYGAVKIIDSKNVVVRYGVIEHNGVKSGDIIDSLYEIIQQETGGSGEDKIQALENSGILPTLGIYGEFDQDVYITREMLSNCIVYLANLYNKNNTPDNFINNKLDAIKYENTNYVIYNSLMDNGTDYFDGDTVPTVDETISILDNFKNLLANTPVIENQNTDDTVSVLNLAETNLEIPDDIVNEANKTLENKSYVQVYNSVAIHSTPRNIYELRENIERLNIGDPYSSNNNYNFIGIDEGLWDYSLIDIDLIDGLENPDVIKQALMPKYITLCNLPNGIGINYEDSKVTLYHSNFNNMGIINADNKMVYYTKDAYLISNNSVIERGEYYLSSEGKLEMVFNTNNISKADYIGLITEMYNLSPTGGYDRVLVLFNTSNLSL